MRLTSLILTLSATTLSCFAQDGISTGVSRSVTLQADEANFTIVATTGLDTTQQQVKQALEAAGIPGANFVAMAAGQNSYNYQEPPITQLFYQFSYTSPAAGIKDGLKKLEALRAALPDLLKGLQYGASANASEASIESARQTVIPQLIAEARKKAAFLASAAGLNVTGVLGVTESNYGSYGSISSYLNVAVLSQPMISSSGTNSSGTQFTFYVNVRFGVSAN